MANQWSYHPKPFHCTEAVLSEAGEQYLCPIDWESVITSTVILNKDGTPKDS